MKVTAASKEAVTNAPSEEIPRATGFVGDQPNASDGTELDIEFSDDPFDEVCLSEGHPDEAVLDSELVTKAAADISEMRSNDPSPRSVLPT